jgi:hypothetical protein
MEFSFSCNEFRNEGSLEARLLLEAINQALEEYFQCEVAKYAPIVGMPGYARACEGRSELVDWVAQCIEWGDAGPEAEQKRKGDVWATVLANLTCGDREECLQISTSESIDSTPDCKPVKRRKTETNDGHGYEENFASTISVSEDILYADNSFLDFSEGEMTDEFSDNNQCGGSFLNAGYLSDGFCADTDEDEHFDSVVSSDDDLIQELCDWERQIENSI